MDLIVFAMSLFWSWFVSSGGLCVGGLGSIVLTGDLIVLIHIWAKGGVVAP